MISILNIRRVTYNMQKLSWRLHIIIFFVEGIKMKTREEHIEVEGISFLLLLCAYFVKYIFRFWTHIGTISRSIASNFQTLCTLQSSTEIAHTKSNSDPIWCINKRLFLGIKVLSNRIISASFLCINWFSGWKWCNWKWYDFGIYRYPYMSGCSCEELVLFIDN